MRKISYTIGGLFSLGLAYASFEYLAFALFRAGLSEFYSIASQVPETCNDVVASAAIAFSGIYDYVAWAVALVFMLLGVFLLWRGWSQS